MILSDSGQWVTLLRFEWEWGHGVTEFDEDRPIANGAANAVDMLNSQLSAIPNGGSLVIVDLSNDLYHACDGYSSTQLRMVQLGGTASLAWYKSAPRDESKSGALSLGTAVHTAILEPARFDEDFVCAPDVNLRTSDGKAELAAFEEQCEADGLTVMKSDDYRKVCLMRDSALAQPVIAALLQRGLQSCLCFIAQSRVCCSRFARTGSVSCAAYLS